MMACGMSPISQGGHCKKSPAQRIAEHREGEPALVGVCGSEPRSSRSCRCVPLGSGQLGPPRNPLGHLKPVADQGVGHRQPRAPEQASNTLPWLPSKFMDCVPSAHARHTYSDAEARMREDGIATAYGGGHRVLADRKEAGPVGGEVEAGWGIGNRTEVCCVAFSGIEGPALTYGVGGRDAQRSRQERRAPSAK